MVSPTFTKLTMGLVRKYKTYRRIALGIDDTLKYASKSLTNKINSDIGTSIPSKELHIATRKKLIKSLLFPNSKHFTNTKVNLLSKLVDYESKKRSRNKTK